MLFRNVYLRTLRGYRIPVVGWGYGMGLIMYTQMAAVASLISTPAQRADLAALAKSFSWAGDPVAVDTVGGYATWKVGLFMLLVAVWPLLAATRTLRGEEERGSMDMLLSLPRSRARVALEKVAAIGAALLGIGVVIGLVVYVAGLSFHADYGLGDALLFGLNISLFCAFITGLALLISQFTGQRSTAAGITGGLLALFIVVDMVHRIYANTDWISRLSPVYAYNLSKPLVPGHSASAEGMLILAVTTVVLTGAAIALFALRDIGAPVPLPFTPRRVRPVHVAAELPASSPSLRSVYLRSLGSMRTPAIWWTLGIAAGAGWFVAIVKQSETNIATLFQGSSFLSTLLTREGGGANGFAAQFLSSLFILVPLFLMVFCVTQVTRWAGDEQDGRLDMVLTTPQSRQRVMLSRFAALATITVLIALATLTTTAAGSAASGFGLKSGDLIAAALGTVPLGLLIACLGFLFAGWLRAAVDTGLLSLVLLAWFFISFIGPALNWPDATLRASAFYYYGTPLISGIPWSYVIGVLVVAAVLLSGAVLRFSRQDVAT